LDSKDPQIRRTAITKIREIQAVQPVIDAGLVPTLISLLDSEDTYLQGEASWIVTNIASGTTQQTGLVVEAGAIPKLIGLSTSASEDVSDHAVWALANIVGDSPGLRDRIEDEGGIDTFLRLVNNAGTTPPKVRRRAVWGVSNYLNSWPENNLSIMRVRNLHEAISEDDMKSIIDAIQALCRILDRGVKRSDVIETGVVPRLVHLLADSSFRGATQKHALKCMGYFVDGDDDDADAVIDAGLLPALLVLIEAKNQDLRQMALWNASNIAAGSLSQVYALLDCGLLKLAVGILMDDLSPTICRREACWMVSNLSERVCGDEKIWQAFIEERGAESLSTALLIPDRNTREVAISGITSLLKCQDSEGCQFGAPIFAIIRSSSGPQNLRAIRDSRWFEDDELRTDCHNLLTHYFPEYSRRARV
ncbi:hypothetical protein M407DRAFT_215885, partial [Tulasnella calospora MUT 4182]